MDWTSIYAETGEEELLIPGFIEKHSAAPRLSRLVSRLYHIRHDGDILAVEEDIAEASSHRLLELTAPVSSYDLRALYYLAINYILGVGCLGVPHAFARAGFILCTAVLLTVTLLSYMTVMWVAESEARLELYKAAKSLEQQDTLSEQTFLVPNRQEPNSGRDGDVPDLERYEVVDLVSFFLGPLHKFTYQASLMALMYVGLLAYTQVFCGAISALLWSNATSLVGVQQVIFGAMVVPLACVELDEQVTIQSLMAKVRFVAMFIMIGGSVTALFLDDKRATESQHPPPYFAPADPEGCRMSYTVCFSGFGVAFSTALFSQLFQHSVPGLLRPLRDQPEKLVGAPKVFAASLMTTCSFYLLLGTSAASYFGADTKSSVNLNFSSFTFGLDPERLPVIVESGLHFLAGVVVLFPALDTISVFPLIANTLGNNLLAAAGPSFVKWIAHHFTILWHDENHVRGDRKYSMLPMNERKVIMRRASKAATIFWRLVAALPPLFGSLWATDLSFSLLLSAVAGIYVAFYAPSLLQLTSSRLVAGRTMFGGWWSSAALAYPVLLFSTFSVGVVLIQIRDAVVTMHQDS